MWLSILDNVAGFHFLHSGTDCADLGSKCTENTQIFNFYITLPKCVHFSSEAAKLLSYKQKL